jgi:protein scribble
MLDNEKLGVEVKGGIQGQPGNPLDQSDEGIFISYIIKGSCASRCEDLKVGQRIIEVNGESLLGSTNQMAVDALQKVGNSVEV